MEPLGRSNLQCVCFINLFILIYFPVKSSSTPGRCTGKCAADCERAWPQRTARVRTPRGSCSPNCGSRRCPCHCHLLECHCHLETGGCRPMRRSPLCWKTAEWSTAPRTPRSVPPWEPRNNEVVGCLLYTSPSPRDRQKSRMPSSA